MSRYVDLEGYECVGCRNDRGCGSCPHNEERIREYHDKYGNNDGFRHHNGYGFNITD